MNEIQTIRKETGLSQAKFAAHFNIPVRTIQKWEIGQASPPHYVIQMIKNILLFEQIKYARDSKILPECFHELFWDCEIDKLDLEKNSDYIISRLYNFGGIKGRKWANLYYDEKTIVKAACNRRDFHPIVANYLRTEFNLNKEDMAYYKLNVQKINWQGQ